MNKNIVVVLLSSILSACATFGPYDTYSTYQVDTWLGQNFDSYIISYGAPTSNYALQNGNTAYSFKKACTYTNGEEELVVVVDAQNIIQSRSVTSSCPTAAQHQAYNAQVDVRANLARQREQERQTRLAEVQHEISRLDIDLKVTHYDRGRYEMRVSDATFALSKARADAAMSHQTLPPGEEQKLQREVDRAKADLAEWDRQVNAKERRLKELVDLERRLRAK